MNLQRSLLSPEGAVVENGASEGGSSPPVAPNASRPSEDTATDNGPVDSTSSDGEPANPVRKRRQRRRTPRSEPAHPSSSHDNNPPAVRKPSRAKSQPPSSTKEENRWSSCRLDWTEKLMEMKRTRNDVSLTRVRSLTRWRTNGVVTCRQMSN